MPSALNFHSSKSAWKLQTITDSVDSKIIAAHFAEIYTKLATIPGVGTTLGATILSEIGDINRFEKPKHVINFLTPFLPFLKTGEKYKPIYPPYVSKLENVSRISLCTVPKSYTPRDSLIAFMLITN